MNYPALARTIATALAQTGSSVTLARATGQSYDQTTGELTGGTTSQWTLNAVREEYTAAEIDGELVQRGDVRYLLPATGPVPAVGDTLTAGGVTWKIVTWSAEQPADVPLCYTVQARQ